MQPSLHRLWETPVPCTCIAKRCALHALWAVPAWLLCSFFLLKPECSRHLGGESSTLGLRSRIGDGPPGSSASVDAEEARYPPSDSPPRLFPPRIEPMRRSPELEQRLKGTEIMALLQGSRSSSINNASADNSTTEQQDIGELSSLGVGGLGSRCGALDWSVLAKGMGCGAPLAEPCFDRSRCRGERPSVYVYDGTCSLADSSALPPSDESLMLSHTWREAAREAGVLSERYEDACIFVHVNKLLDRPPCASESPLWNGGANHVMVDLTDRTRDEKPTVAESAAMDASSNVLSCYYRTGYDFAVPLRHKLGFDNLTHLAPWEREYFITVKGNLYLSGNGYHDRLSLVPVHNEPEGAVVALNCFEMHDEHLLPENAEFCDALNVTASRHDYADLMNTTFGLVPGGRSPATYRLAEVMSAGGIPVFVGRDYVRPFPERLDWPAFSFTFPPEEVGRSMMETLRSVTPEELWEMQRRSMEAFLDIFGEEPGYGRIARVVIDEVVKRVAFH